MIPGHGATVGYSDLSSVAVTESLLLPHEDALAAQPASIVFGRAALRYARRPTKKLIDVPLHHTLRSMAKRSWLFKAARQLSGVSSAPKSLVQCRTRLSYCSCVHSVMERHVMS